jgi:general stress protein 26
MSSKETMKEVLSNHNLMHIATVDENGLPSVRGVDYTASEMDNVLYFLTRKDSRKVKHFQNNQNVALVIDHDCPSIEDLLKLKYIKGTGAVNIVEDPQEAQKAMGLLMQKFPFLKDLPGDPSDFVVVRLELKDILVTDNNISFGHTEAVTF